MRKLAALALLTMWISGCATASSNVCPREVEYTREQQARAADELLALPRDGMVRGTMMPDYGRLRDQARACRGA
jgi:PBP1b-binding outer membrane lipoprotein LpoB